MRERSGPRASASNDRVAAIIENPNPREYLGDVVSVADELGEELGTLAGPTVGDLLDDEVEAFGQGVQGEALRDEGSEPHQLLIDLSKRVLEPVLRPQLVT